MFIIKTILFLFLFVFIMGVMVAVSLFRKVHHAARQFQDQMNGRGGAHSSSTGGFTGSREGTASSQEGVFDSRTRQQSGQKIIPKDEGEYVDFEEAE